MKPRTRVLAALGLALLLGGSVSAAAPRKPAAKPKSYPTGVFSVAGHVVPASAVLDARALPDLSGKPSLMVTLNPQIAATLVADATAPLPVTLDGKALGASPADALKTDHVIQLSGDFGSYDTASAMARRISGKDPLPESEGDDP